MKWHACTLLPKRTRWFLLTALLALTVLPARAVETSCNNNGGSGFAIPTSSTTTIPIPFTFADNGVVVDVNVSVDISHPYVGDLSATIEPPVGSPSVLLFHRPGLPGPPTGLGPPYGCDGNNIDVVFDDESVNGRLEDAACGNNPAYGGSHTTHDAAPDNLSSLDGTEVTGDWDFTFLNAEPYDFGTMNEACITVRFAGVVLDQWVSTSPTCADTVGDLVALSGEDVYVCYTLTNTGDESLVLGPGDWNDSLGNDLSALEGVYGAGVSQTVNFGPFVAGSPTFPFGTIDATSDVTMTGNSVDFPAPNTLFSDEAVQVTVANSPPGTGNKPLYLYSNNDLSRIPTAADQTELGFNEGVTRTWTLTPGLQGTLNLDTSGGQIPVTLYMRETGSGTVRDMTLTLAGSVSGLIGTVSPSIALTNTSAIYTINVPITGATSLVAGETITLFFRNDTTGFGQRAIQLDPSDGATNRSLVNLPSNSVINVNWIQGFDVDYATDPIAAPISSIEPGQTLYIRTQISDPFGSFDITSATIDLADPMPTLQVDDGAMAQVLDSGADTKIFEYTYNVPVFPVQGYWRFDVLATEGNDAVVVTHTNFIDFPIFAPPQLTVVKMSTPANVEPGELATQSVIVTNTGAGPATNVRITDTVSIFTTVNQGSFVCSAGCPASGISLGTPIFTTDGNGNVVQWDMDMTGTLSPSGSFTIEYELTVN